MGVGFSFMASLWPTGHGPPPHRARHRGRTSGSPSGSSQAIRGSRRNHDRCRRAKARVRRTACCDALRPAGTPLFDVGQELAVAEGLAGRARQPSRPRGQGPHLVEQPVVQPAVEPLGDPAIDLGRLGGQAELARPRSAGRPSSPGPNEENGRPEPSVTSRARTTRRRLAGSCARPPAGRGRPAGRRARPGPPAGRPRPSSSAATSGQRPGSVEIVDHRPQVEAGPADQQGPSPPAGDVGQGRARPPPGTGATVNSSAGSTRSSRWWGTSARGRGGRLGRADVHAPVDGHRVDATRARRRPAGAADRQGQRRLPRGRGPDQGHRPSPGRLAPNRRRAGIAPSVPGAGRGTEPQRRPVRWWGAAPVTSTSAKDAGAPGPARSAAGAKWTSLPWPGPARSARRVPAARPLDQHLLDPPDPGLVAGQGRALDHDPQPLEALGHHLGGDEVVAPWRRPGCPGRGEKMKV